MLNGVRYAIFRLACPGIPDFPICIAIKKVLFHDGIAIGHCVIRRVGSSIFPFHEDVGIAGECEFSLTQDRDPDEQ